MKKIVIGTSFSPEELEHKGLSYTQTVEALKIVHQKFGINDIRLGIRWNKAVDEDGRADLVYYKSFLDYCLANAVRLTLNVGPIKTFRWPEDHVPKAILGNLEETAFKASEIEVESELANYSAHYLEELLNELRSEYSSEELRNIVMIQPENEAFKAFGVHKWTMSVEYMQKLIEIIWEFFPEGGILLNSSGCLDIPQCIKVAKKYPEKMNKFTFGVNYYYKTPSSQRLPFMNWYDDIWRSRLWGMSCATNKKLAEKYGYNIEVTEAQLEGWGDKIKGPGESVDEFEKMLDRIAEHILPDQAGLIRVWGIEDFAKNYILTQLTVEQKAIIEKIL